MMVNTHFAYILPAIHKVSDIHPDQDTKIFIGLMRRKIKFASGNAPADPA